MLNNLFTVLKQNRDTLYDTRESVELYGKSKFWFERHRWAGTGPKFTKIGRTPYYTGEDLLGFILGVSSEES